MFIADGVQKGIYKINNEQKSLIILKLVNNQIKNSPNIGKIINLQNTIFKVIVKYF